jgi:hypothetical protein
MDKGRLSFLSTFMGSGFNDALLYVNGSFPFILLGKMELCFIKGGVLYTLWDPYSGFFFQSYYFI